MFTQLLSDFYQRSMSKASTLYIQSCDSGWNRDGNRIRPLTNTSNHASHFVIAPSPAESLFSSWVLVFIRMSQNKCWVLLFSDAHVEAQIGGFHDVTRTRIELNCWSRHFLSNAHECHAISDVNDTTMWYFYLKDRRLSENLELTSCGHGMRHRWNFCPHIPQRIGCHPIWCCKSRSLSICHSVWSNPRRKSALRWKRRHQLRYWIRQEILLMYNVHQCAWLTSRLSSFKCIRGNWTL